MDFIICFVAGGGIYMPLTRTWVTVMVRGAEISVVSAGPNGISLPGEVSPVQPTFLTIGAKKSDIDRFAKAELDYDQFRQRIRSLTY